MTKVYSSALPVPFDSVISGHFFFFLSFLSLLVSLQTFLCCYLSFHKMLCALHLYLFLLHDFCFFIIFLFPMKDTKQSFYNFLLVFTGNHFQGFMSLQEDVLLLLFCNMNSWYHGSLNES